MRSRRGFSFLVMRPQSGCAGTFRNHAPPGLLPGHSMGVSLAAAPVMFLTQASTCSTMPRTLRHRGNIRQAIRRRVPGGPAPA